MRVRIFVLALLIFAIFSPAAYAQTCDYPSEGDWFVNETIVCSSVNIVLNGSLLINESGTLTLENSNLRFNSSFDGEFGVENNGTLRVISSTIESETSHAYTFISGAGAGLEIRDSEIRDCGYENAENRKRGVYTESDGTNITNTTFANNYIALLVYSDGNNISGNRIFSNYAGLALGGSGSEIERNIIENNEIGIGTITGENIRIEHNAIKNSTDTAFTEFLLNDTVINNNTFVNNTGGGFRIEGKGNNITNNTIIANAQNSGLEVISSENARIEGNVILGNNYGLSLSCTKNTLLKDNLVNKSKKYDIHMLSSEATFEKTNYTSLIRKWELDVKVTDAEQNPVEDADVVIRNGMGETVFSGQTDSNGEIPEQVLEEIIENETGIFDFNPYSVNVSKSGFEGNFTEFNLTGDFSLVMVMTQTEQPPEGNFTFYIISPMNMTYLMGDLSENGTLLLLLTSEKNMTSCNYSLGNESGQLSELNPLKFRAYLNVSGMEGTYAISFTCESLDHETNHSSVHFTVYPLRECMYDDECEDDEICDDYECVALECECGYAEDHECVDYECCEDDMCDDDEYCDPDTNTCEPVECPCSEKISGHECRMTPGYCCSDLQCGENETCVEHECIERKLWFILPENLVLGQNVSIVVLDQDNEPVNNVKITIHYLDTDPPVSENYYTDSDGVANIPIKYAGRVRFTARKGGYFMYYHSGEVPEPVNIIFILELVILIACLAGIGVVVFMFFRGGGLSVLSRGPLKLEKYVSGSRVMLRVKNRTDRKLLDIKIRDSVPRGAFIRCNVRPKIEPFDSATDMLTWEILELGPKEEVTITYETRRANKGFSVRFEGKEYRA